MSKIHILDCTLRDGGYINKWNFGKENIREIITNLDAANVDIVECGFLRDVPYSEDVSVYSCVSQITPFITPKKESSLYVAMIALGDIAPEKILPCDGTSIDGIRLSFHKHEWEEAKLVAMDLMAKGYKLFIQPVGTTAYMDLELLNLIEEVNKLRPYSFHLVDTLGVLYRNIVIDTAVYGMGRGVGNLATELLAEYVNMNIEQRYSIIPLLTIADKYLMSVYAQQKWGYDLPYFLSAAYQCHPNYAAYLLRKETLDIPTISRMLSLLPVDKRDLYHKDLIEDIYYSIQSCQYDDGRTITELRGSLEGEPILLLAPGATLQTEAAKVQAYIEVNQPIVIAINFIPESFDEDIIFISNRKRLSSLQSKIKQCAKIIATSNLQDSLPECVNFINYASYLGEGKASDNAGAMLIRFLAQVGVKQIALAGFDGFAVNTNENYCVDSYKNVLEDDEAQKKNVEITRQLKLALNDVNYEVITSTRYEI